MLEIRPICENCGRPLPNNSLDAMICTFECTFCRECVEQTLFNVCPNCGGGFERRPTRPKALVEKYPPTTDRLHRPINSAKFATTLELFKDIEPRRR